MNITQAMRLLRLLRLFRAIRLVASDALDVASSSISVTGATAAWIQVVQILVIYAWTAHLMACIWCFTGIAEDTTAYYTATAEADPAAIVYEWSAPIDTNTWTCEFGFEGAEDSPDSWLKAQGLQCATDSRMYTAAFYFATMTITTVGYGDISATTQAEMIVVTVFMVFGAMFFSYIVANVTLVIENVSTIKIEVAEFNSKMALVEDWAAERDLPKKLKKDIRYDRSTARLAGAD